MKVRRNTRASKIGLPPGSLVYVGKEKSQPVTITEFNYAEDYLHETELKDITESKALTENKDFKTWINVDGAHEIDKIEAIGNFLHIDKMVLEDAVNTNSRPKFEDLEDQLFISFKTIKISNENEISFNQLSLILGDDWLLSIDESDGSIFTDYQERIRKAKGVSRKKDIDFLFYRLIDVTVDNYFHVTDYLSDALENLEDEMIDNKDKDLATEIYQLKKKIGKVKKTIIPLREALSQLIRTESNLLSPATINYFRDVYEHTTQSIESVETQRETANDFLNLYMSMQGNKMNEVMKVLTIFATIFIPLTFIAGIYGMNFDLMPELHWKYGYLLAWGVMILVAVALLNYFRRKKWL